MPSRIQQQFGQQPQQQMGGMGAPSAMGATQQPAGQGLPPTGLQQQLNSLNQTYSQVGGMRGIGYDVRGQQAQQAQGMQGQGQLQGQQMMGSTSLDSMARNLAQNYGLAIGRGRLVDDQGNLLMTPEQLANASGGADTLGTAAAKMNFISQAIAKKQNEMQQQKGIAAIQTGLGQVQSRGRGSLAAMQSGFYQDLADLYSNQQYEAAFAYVFGIDRGWEELTRGADLAIRRVFRFVIRWITPPFILLVFLTALVKPEAGDWGAAFAALGAGAGWPLAADSVIGKLLHVGVEGGWFDAAGQPTRRLVQDATRLLLAAVFATLTFLVWRSWRRRGAAAPRETAVAGEERR
jgi:hypothetical protein